MRSTRDARGARVLVRLTSLSLLLAATGCAWGEVKGVEAPDPTQPVLKVTTLAKGLSHVPDKCNVVVRFGGYQGIAGLPILGSADPETVIATVDRWERLNPPVSPARLEVWFTYPTPRNPIDRQFFASPIPLEVIKNAVEGAPSAVPRTSQPGGGHVASSGGAAPTPTPGDAPGQPPRGWGDAVPLSADLDRPSERDLSLPLLVHLSASDGPRYFKVSRPPKGVVQIVIDVKSEGDPSTVNEATWFRVSLLDEAGMSLPHEEQEFVGLGGTKRHVADWRFDGSPVIFKLASGSKAGDWMRIRFQQVPE
ncbi:MAG: hypothetical protein AB7N76_17330 [Planctomycetota bacterium]